MRFRNYIAGLAMAALLFAFQMPAFAASKEIIQLQTQVQTLSDQVARMQQSMDERMGVLKNLVEQSTDSVNKMSVAVTDLQRKSQAESTDTASRLEQVSGHIHTLPDPLDDRKARLAKITKQLDDMQQGSQNLAPGQPAMAASPAGASAGARRAGAAPPRGAP